jgi:hypothetical protein
VLVVFHRRGGCSRRAATQEACCARLYISTVQIHSLLLATSNGSGPAPQEHVLPMGGCGGVRRETAIFYIGTVRHASCTPCLDYMHALTWYESSLIFNLACLNVNDGSEGHRLTRSSLTRSKVDDCLLACV